MSQGSERWAPAPGFEGRYEVSDYGRVRSVTREYIMSNGRLGFVRGRILRPSLDTKGYPRMSIRKNQNGKSRTWPAVHRWVLEAFAPERDGGRNYVNHKNGVRSDNRLCNLEWCTQSENILHAHHSLGRWKDAGNKRGGEHHNARRIVGKCIKTGEVRGYKSISETAADGFNPSDVSSCACGSQRSHRGWLWRHADSPEPADWKCEPKKPARLTKPVVRVAPDGSEVLYPSATAARADGFSNVAIGHVLHGRATQHGGYFWRFADATSAGGGRIRSAGANV